MKSVLTAILIIVSFPLNSLAQTEGSVSLSPDTVVAVSMGKQIPLAHLDPPPGTLEENKKLMAPERYNQWLSERRQQKLRLLIAGPLFKDYAQTRNIEPTPAEIDEFVQKTHESKKKKEKSLAMTREKIRARLDSGDAGDEEKAVLEKQLNTLDRVMEEKKRQDAFAEKNPAVIRRIEENVAKNLIQTWKVNNSLYGQYGGRVTLQQTGPEPLDAYLIFLRTHESNGSFKISNPGLKKDFWDYLTDPSKHEFLPPDKTEMIMKTPWWLMEWDIAP